jgi:hypothetical protein
MLGIAPDSPASGARFVRRFCVVQDSLPEKDTATNQTKFLHTTYSLAIIKRQYLPERKFS